jgi:hypothetical protein
VNGGAEDAGLLDVRHGIECAHGVDRFRRADLENRPRRERRLQLLHRTVRGQTSRLNDRDPMAMLRLIEIMRRHQYRHSALRQIVDEAPELTPRQRIDAPGRLVEKDNRRFMENRASERQALPPAASERAGERALAAAESRHVEHEVASRREPIGAQPVDAAEEGDVLIDRQLLVQRELLRHVADAPLHAFGVAADVEPADDRRPRCRLEQSTQHADGG